MSARQLVNDFKDSTRFAVAIPYLVWVSDASRDFDKDAKTRLFVQLQLYCI